MISCYSAGPGTDWGITHVPYQTYTVTRGSRYRFRIIGAQTVFAYKFSIDQHELKVGIRDIPMACKDAFIDTLYSCFSLEE